MTRPNHSKRLGSAVLTAVALVLLVSCGGSDDTPGASAPTSSESSSATTAAPDACADVTALKASLQALTSVKPLQDGLTALEGAVADTKTALDAAVASASAELKPAVEQVKTQFAAVQTAAEGVTADNLREKGPAIAVALHGLGTAARSLATTLTQGCPES